MTHATFSAALVFSWHLMPASLLTNIWLTNNFPALHPGSFRNIHFIMQGMGAVCAHGYLPGADGSCSQLRLSLCPLTALTSPETCLAQWSQHFPDRDVLGKVVGTLLHPCCCPKAQGDLVNVSPSSLWAVYFPPNEEYKCCPLVSKGSTFFSDTFKRTACPSSKAIIA